MVLNILWLGAKTHQNTTSKIGFNIIFLWRRLILVGENSFFLSSARQSRTRDLGVLPLTLTGSQRPAVKNKLSTAAPEAVSISAAL